MVVNFVIFKYFNIIKGFVITFIETQLLCFTILLLLISLLVVLTLLLN